MRSVRGFIVLTTCGLLGSCGLLAEREKSASGAKDRIVDVVFASRDLYQGVPLTDADVGVRQVPASCVPADVTFRQASEVIGRTPRQHVLAGEPVREERLGRPDPANGLGAILTPETVALTLTLAPTDGLPPLVQAGNYVDVAWAPDPLRVRDSTADGARVVMQGVKIVALRGWLLDAPGAPPADAGRPMTVTLQLRPDEAERLLTGRASGQLQFSIRSDTDILQWAGSPPPRVEDLRRGAPWPTDAAADDD